MILLIDIGNSRIKICYFHNNEFIEHNASEYRLDNFTQIFESLVLNQPQKIFVANVAGDVIKQKLIDWCLAQWQLEPVFAFVQEKIDRLSNAYSEPQQLGVDRWVSMLACRRISQNHTLLVSFGTATTLDAIDNKGQHLGGMIVPGYALMQSSLISNTQEIRPEASVHNLDDSLFGKSTFDGLQKGAVTTLIALVEMTYSNMKEQYNVDVDCIITGGFAAELKEKLTIEYNYQAHLVLMGLNDWRKYL